VVDITGLRVDVPGPGPASGVSSSLDIEVLGLPAVRCHTGADGRLTVDFRAVPEAPAHVVRIRPRARCRPSA
jgi:hypothetical protein